MTTDSQPRVLSFGDFRLDCRSGELRKSKREIRLQPQPAKLLVLLATQRGEVVTRAEIQKSLWDEDTFVDFEHGINFSIKQIRDALGDDAEKPRYIETVPRVGYRFMALTESPGAPERSPYPGLNSFSSGDSALFFGREDEVESVLRKLESRQMLALIGASGAGKSSFLRAGLLPSLPEGWRAVMATPGSAPLRALIRALAAEVPRETEAIQELMEDVVASAARWRKGCARALVVVDAFEELFTLNPPEVQTEFANLLGRLVREAEVQVVLSMRDDFLIRCHDFEDLKPVFLDLTPLGPLKGAALRRALVEPARSCEYRFETEELVEEMLREVEGERGALPLLAFAALRLWEKRDREKRLLTRKAYEEIGGVGGALARHAEETLAGIGAERTPLVRELFRNLVTAQGTRARREVSDLLSIFDEERDAAVQVLGALAGARLLTFFDESVEIIHESLLSAWPRLVQWRNQDDGGALLRDQLRQAAAVWHERERPDGLLWTGTPYGELSLWRERYEGALSSVEEAYANAATKLAGRRRRRRRLAAAAAFFVLLGAVGVVTSLWRRSVLEVSRREAAQILALGRLELEDRPTAALAHAIASLERADSDEARRFAVEALWHGAAAIVLPGNINTADFSPDGHWLATGGWLSGVQLWSRDGGPPKTLGGPDPKGNFLVQFSPESDVLAAGGETARFWSIPEGKEIRKVELGGRTGFFRRGLHLLSTTRTSEQTLAVRDWSVREEVPEVLASLDPGGASEWDFDSSGDWFITGRGKSVYVSTLREPDSSRSRLVGTHDGNVVSVASDPAGPRIVSGDEMGGVRIWSFAEGSAHLERAFQAPGPNARLDPTGSWLTVRNPYSTAMRDATYVWDLNGPPDAEPRVLRYRDHVDDTERVLHPEGLWLLNGNNYEGGELWPLHSKYSVVLRSLAPGAAIAFTPDGESLVSTSLDRTVRLWPLSHGAGQTHRVLMEDKTAFLGSFIAVDPLGRYVLVNSRYDPRVFLVPLEGGRPRQMPGFTQGQGWVFDLAFSPDGRFALAVGSRPPVLRIWDLQTGGLQMLDLMDDEHCWGEAVPDVLDLEFLSNRRFLTSGAWGIRLWNLEEGTSEEILPCKGKEVGFRNLATDRLGRHFLVVDVNQVEHVSAFGLYDVESKTFREIASHGNRLQAVALDPTGTIIVTGDMDGVVRVGSIAGDEPHLLVGESSSIYSVAVSPDGRLIASASHEGTIRLWPMPDGAPFHRLPYEEFLERLRSFTNLRVVADESSETEYRVEIGLFPGWAKLPSW